MIDTLRTQFDRWLRVFQHDILDTLLSPMLQTRGVNPEEVGLNPQSDWGSLLNPYVTEHVKVLVKQPTQRFLESGVGSAVGPVPSGQTRSGSSGSSDTVADSPAEVRPEAKPVPSKAVEQAQDFRYAKRTIVENVQKFVDETRGNNRLTLQVLRDPLHVDKHGSSVEDCGARNGRLGLLRMLQPTCLGRQPEMDHKVRPCTLPGSQMSFSLNAVVDPSQISSEYVNPMTTTFQP